MNVSVPVGNVDCVIMGDCVDLSIRVKTGVSDSKENHHDEDSIVDLLQPFVAIMLCMYIVKSISY